MLKLTQTIDQKVYFTGDWHLGHQRDFVWQTRGYESYNDHTYGIINKTNEIVHSNDILFMLGDFCLNTLIGRFHEYIAKINCRNIWMIWGNHNNPHEKQIYQPNTREYLAENVNGYHHVYPLSFQNIKYLGHYYEVAVDGQMIILFHYPISSWNHMAKGAWMLHGHMHCHNSPSCGKILDVGWDGYSKPLSFLEVKSILDTRPIIGDGGHHS